MLINYCKCSRNLQGILKSQFRVLNHDCDIIFGQTRTKPHASPPLQRRSSMLALGQRTRWCDNGQKTVSYRPTCRALKMTTGVRGERVALLSRSCSSLSCSPQKSVGGLRVCVPQYWTELKASGKRESFLKRSDSSLSTDSDDFSKTRHRWRGCHTQ